MARPKVNHIGEEKIMNCGMRAKIIRYENSKDIGVEFDNGYVIKNVQYNQFVKGNIYNYKYKNVPKIGDVFKTNEGCEYNIIEVISSTKIKIEFQDDIKYKKYVANKEIKNGSIRNPFLKNVFGVGYYGGELKFGEFNRMAYEYWHRMIERCYSKKYLKKHIRYYLICTVCDEWLNYYNFNSWFKENYYEIENDNDRICLDKDILVKGNKVYSPETCVFVPNRINCLFTKTDKNRGKY